MVNDATLTDRQAQAIALHRRGLSQGEIAEAMAITRQRVSQLLAGARHSLDHRRRIDPECGLCVRYEYDGSVTVRPRAALDPAPRQVWTG